MKLPILLEEYLDSTEQEPDTMTEQELLQEAKWTLQFFDSGNPFENEKAHPAQIAALKRFIKKHQTQQGKNEN